MLPDSALVTEMATDSLGDSVSQGVLSVRWVVMPIANITSIDINTGMLDRLFGLETLVVSAAASAPGLRALLKGATRGSLTCWGVHANTTEQFMAAMHGGMGG